MTSHASVPERRFYRNADKAMLGGVCAGIADYFGFNLCVTRLLVVIAFFTMPLTLIGYLALVARHSSSVKVRIAPPCRSRVSQGGAILTFTDDE